MQTFSTEAFLEACTASGLGFDPRYPQARSLTFLPPSGHFRFWTQPGEPSRWPHFVTTLFGGRQQSGTVTVWPRRGRWPSSVGRPSADGTQAILFGGLGVPDGLQGAVEFSADEFQRAVALLVVQMVGMYNDLYVLPAGGDTLLQFSHHDVVHAGCRDEGTIDSLVAAMAGAGYSLPTELPDATFKRPPWMPIVVE